jgi:hypothetical protein
MKMLFTLSKKVFLVEGSAVIDPFNDVRAVSGQTHFPDPVGAISGFPERLVAVEERKPAGNGGRVCQLFKKR